MTKMAQKYKYTCHICGFVTDDEKNVTPIYSMVDHVNTHVKGVTIVSIAEWCKREEKQEI
jgi:hypothetical protein